MKPSLPLAALLGLYGLVWRAARPVLRRHRRLGDGFDQRLVPVDWVPHSVDLWVQAASGGEAFLARQLLMELARDPSPLRILFTSCTRQGLDTLEAARNWAADHAPHIQVLVRVFPLDQPDLMRRAVSLAAPKLLVLLETELWPGLLAACAEARVPVALVNGRMTEKSLSGYRLLGPLWRYAAPQKILAISQDDAARFAALFGQDRVTTMPNMKFDAVHTADTAADAFPDLLPQGLPVVLLASVRKEEEDLLLPAIQTLRERLPQAAIVVAPRHMERVDAWQTRLRQVLAGDGRAALLRSAEQPAGPGAVVVWDRFGELRPLYARADAVFVGGSLAPLGGQNFLEAAVAGQVPVLGPHWKNFVWVGEAFFEQGLGERVPDATALVLALVRRLEDPVTREKRAARAAAYVVPRQGGTRAACGMIGGMLGRG